MLTTTKQLKGLLIHATDGELGEVKEFYFDDESWVIRYLIVETGGWLGGKPVLISPFSVIRTDWQVGRLDVALTRRQVADSPSIDRREPVSRQTEAEYLDYYGYPYYWGGPHLWGQASYPVGMADPSRVSAQGLESMVNRESSDAHLRSTDEVTGYHIEATNGEIGHVFGFVVDNEAWAIRFLEVATKNWWPGKKVLVSPSWITRVSWHESKVYLDLSREAIQNGPPYIESDPIDREYESQLYRHHNRPPYWPDVPDRESVHSLTGV